MKTKIIITCVTAILLLSATYKLRSNKTTVEANVFRPETDKKIPVQTAVASIKQLKKASTYTGTFAANREVLLIPQMHGQVTGVFFDDGDFVKEGQLLVQIDDDILQAQYKAADVNYETAKRNLERHQNASVSGGVSQVQLDNLTLNLSSAESQRSQLAKQIALTKITAPFSGTITLRDVEVGSVVGAGAIAQITDLTQLKLEVLVPEKEIDLFREGEKAEVSTDVYPGKKIMGRIDHVADVADFSHNYLVRVIIRNTNHSAKLKAGMYGTTTITNSSPEKALVIPRTALLGSAKNPQVFVVENGKAVLRTIETGAAIDEALEVLKGLRAGDVVITTGHINLSDGSHVAILK